HGGVGGGKGHKPPLSRLVNQIYQKIDIAPTPMEQKAIKHNRSDAALNLLELRLHLQERLNVRRALAQALTPNLHCKGATDTHAALLRLAHNREGMLRLVTTNFDRVFDAAAERSGQTFHAYAAPMLPIPKQSRWNGLVYLHGRLPDDQDESELQRLVVTSGDFGLAYLTEGWAARFVSELFRNHTVCFVGYSINDPMLRYMMDALAADKMLGEVTPQAWAFGACRPGQEKNEIKEWRARGVTPILYQVPTGSRKDKKHALLHSSLHAWANAYRDGVMGKEQIVVRHARALPLTSTPQDDFVGRMLWALLDKSGLPAKRFAEFNPVPPLEWLLDVFAKERFSHADLPRFGVPVCGDADSDTKPGFSLIQRPAPCHRAPKMTLVSGGVSDAAWDPVMHHLASWLVRHMNDPRLILWIANRGGQLDKQWVELIERQLERLARLEREGKASELDEIRTHAPNAIPVPPMRTLWRLLLGGLVKPPWETLDLQRWHDRLRRDGLTVSLQMELRALLSPKVKLYEASASTEDPTHTRQLVNWDLELTADDAHATHSDYAGHTWQSVLPLLQEEFQQLLRDALDLLRELGEDDDHTDRNFMSLPSIFPHPQNCGLHDWVFLIESLRDAWLAVYSVDGIRARHIAQAWFAIPYPTFKRLAFFAACQPGCIAPGEWVDWLLADDARWLWARGTQQEKFRLLVLQGGHLAQTDQERLESAILAGNPRETDQESVAYLVWWHLAELNTSGLTLGKAATTRLGELSRAHPTWELAEDHEDPDFNKRRNVEIAPNTLEELVPWLKQTQPDRFPFYEDNWPTVCRTRFADSLNALRQISREEVWPIARWRDALQTWREDDLLPDSWRDAAPLVLTMPDDVARELVHPLTSWIESASRSIRRPDAILLDLCRRILHLPLAEESGMTRHADPRNQPVFEALNHPVGHVTQALLNLWSHGKPNDNERLPPEIESFFSELCDIRVDRFRHGRVLLGANAIPLFRVDRPWTTQHLLPLFSWDNPAEAQAVWEGFLRSPRIYQPLLVECKPQFLECARHYDKLGEYHKNFAAILTYAALEPMEGFTWAEFRSALDAFPKEGLEEAARVLTQALEGAADQREAYWRHHVLPVWQRVWPKSRDLRTPLIAKSLSQLCIAAGDEFPAALTAVQGWLRPLNHPGHTVDQLHKSRLCQRFPTDALRLLAAIIANQTWAPQELGRCLQEIAQSEPKLAEDPRYRSLQEYAYQREVWAPEM
ncbi:MAG: SIR2 family protein, partial [Magnetococcales bacterium]|nr:SIR2 family protein [Magnetococcales bacterium]